MRMPRAPRFDDHDPTWELSPMAAATLLLALSLVAGTYDPDDFVIVPLRIHVLAAPDFDLANCKLKDSDVNRVAAKLNAIWSQAGISFAVESIVREQAAQRDRFRLLVELTGGQLDMADFQLLLPTASRAFDGISVYFFHELPFNGAYLGGDIVIVQEGAQLNEVEGGSDEPMARVLGHCLGRALALVPKREPQSSLMALGTTGFALDRQEIERARRVVNTVTGTLTVPEARKAADAAQAAGQSARAKQLRSWVESARPKAVPKSPRSKRTQVRASQRAEWLPRRALISG
jgi:hypothetical protein